MFFGNPDDGRRARIGIWGLLLVVALGGCAHRDGSGGASLDPLPSHRDDRLGSEDLLEVRVYGEGDLSGNYRIAPDGTIDFPFVGRIVMSGLTVGEVQQEIVKRLKAGYLNNPQVTVMIREWNSRKVSVLGQVQRPGLVAYFPNMTIVDAIVSAGGFTGTAAKNSVNLRREVSGKDAGAKKVEIRTFPVADITEGRAPNVVVIPGDVVVVEERLF
jgi:polysaccharide export outer membrane protein